MASPGTVVGRNRHGEAWFVFRSRVTWTHPRSYGRSEAYTTPLHRLWTVHITKGWGSVASVRDGDQQLDFIIRASRTGHRTVLFLSVSY